MDDLSTLDLDGNGDDDDGTVTTGADRTGRRRGPRRRRSRAASAAIAAGLSLVLVVVAAGVTAGAVALHLASTWNDSTTTLDRAFPAEADRPAPTSDGALNVLLMGSDSRGDELTLDVEGPSGQRTDTMMLVHVDADRRHASVMSLMRDLWVPVPGLGDAKLNAAYAHGGSPLAVQTVEGLLGVRVDHVAIVDFEGLADLTTALGGVDVVSDRAFRSTALDRARSYEYVQGVNHLEGDAALSFVRERAAFADADHQRVRNQQAFLRGVLASLVSGSTLTDPTRITAFVTAVAPSVTVDAGLDAASLVSLGASLRGIGLDDVDFFTVPDAGTGTSPDGQSIVLPDEAAMRALSEALRDDEVRAFLATRPGRP